MSPARPAAARRRVDGPEPHASADAGRRPLSARSVIASTLLGIEPPRLPVQLLVRSGEAFGISEGTTRTAVSRMVAAGELTADGDGYRLAGGLLARQERQRAGRSGDRTRWDGRWELAVVTADRRTSAARAELRTAFRSLHLGELREGFWLRPNNLPEDRQPDAWLVANEQCRRFIADAPDDAGELTARLWDLGGWSATADALSNEMRIILPKLRNGDLDALAPGYLLSAEVLRLFVADPLLPTEYLPSEWPGDALRREYDEYDSTFKALWRDWFRAQR